MVKATVAYDGTEFHGFARQPGLRTVQGVLEETLARLLGYPVEVFGSGRTDAGVHARGQVVHWTQTTGPPIERLPVILRRMLPRDVVCLASERTSDDFHARYSARSKTYRYTIQRELLADVFTNRFAWHVPKPLSVDAMREAAAHLCGEHDFTSFCAAASPVADKCRTIYRLEIDQCAEYLQLHCTGNGFLQYMVRIISGTLVDVGLGQLTAGDIPRILAQRDRRLAGTTAPAHGLCLWAVDYDGPLAADGATLSRTRVDGVGRERKPDDGRGDG